MKNKYYTVFVSKGNDILNEHLLVETEDSEKYKKALVWAKNNGYKITREYKPDTYLEKPDFVKTIK